MRPPVAKDKTAVGQATVDVCGKCETRPVSELLDLMFGSDRNAVVAVEVKDPKPVNAGKDADDAGARAKAGAGKAS